MERADIKLAIDMLKNLELSGGDEVVIGHIESCLEDCGNEIAKLRAQLEAVTMERDKLKTVPMKYRRMQFNAELQDQLSAAQAELAALKQAQGEPVCWLTPCGEGWMLRYVPPVNDTPLGWKALYERPANLAELKAAEWEKAANIALNLRHTDIDEETLDWCNGTLACEAALRAEAEKIRKGEWNDRQRTA
mgnify:CR=1 FL=1